MYQVPESSPEFINVTDLIAHVLYQVNDWAHAEFKHQNLEQEIRFALDNLHLKEGEVDSETAIRAAAGLIWAVLQSREDRTLLGK
jgi:hypothetical protein